MTDARRPTELEVAVEHLRAVVARPVFEVNYTQPVGRPIPPSDTAALYEAACLVVALSETDLINCAESTASHHQ